MGIHGDKSQQERDWVLNGEYFQQFLQAMSSLLLNEETDELLVLQNSNMEKHRSWLLQMLHPEV